MPRRKPVQAPAPPALPAEDFLLSPKRCAMRLGFHVSHWSAYWRQWKRLVYGRRVVVVQGKGRVRWLRSAVVDHIRLDLPTHREQDVSAARWPSTVPVPAAAGAA